MQKKTLYQRWNQHPFMMEGTLLSSWNCWLWAMPVTLVSLIFFSLLAIGCRCHFAGLGGVWSPDFKKRDWEENSVEYWRISWGRNSCKIALGWQSGDSSHSPLLSRAGYLRRYEGSNLQHHGKELGWKEPLWSAQLKAGIMSKPDEIAQSCAQSCFEDLWGWRQILFLSFY